MPMLHRIMFMLALTLTYVTASAAQSCLVYQPDKTSFPVTITSSGSAHIIITHPDGTVNPFDSPYSRKIQMAGPSDLAALVFGSAYQNRPFEECKKNTDFGSKGLQSDSGTSKARSGIFSVSTAFNESDGSINVEQDGINTEPANDGNPCTQAAPCVFDTIDFVNVLKYDVKAGGYAATTTTNRHSSWNNPANGDHWDVTAFDTGESSGVAVPSPSPVQNTGALNVSPSLVDFGTVINLPLLATFDDVSLTNVSDYPVTISSVGDSQTIGSCSFNFPFTVGINFLFGVEHYNGLIIPPHTSQTMYFTYGGGIAQCNLGLNEMIFEISTKEGPAGNVIGSYPVTVLAILEH